MKYDHVTLDELIDIAARVYSYDRDDYMRIWATAEQDPEGLHTALIGCKEVQDALAARYGRGGPD